MPRATYAVLLVLFVACDKWSTAPPPPPGYTGPLPSLKAQTALAGLYQKSFRDRKGDIGGGTWTVGSSLVGPPG